MTAYDWYLSGEIQDLDYAEDAIRNTLAQLPQIDLHD
jgi:hypothetical protein